MAILSHCRLFLNIIDGATLAPATGEDILLRLLQRTDMVELAKQPGQGRREAAQKMREVSDAFGAPQHLRAQGHQVSRFGAAEHDKVTALARHRDLLEKARYQHEAAPADSSVGQNAAAQAQEVPQEADVKVVPDETEDLLSLGPVAYAKSLCDKTGLTREQRGPVALIAREMQTAYEAERQRR